MGKLCCREDHVSRQAALETSTDELERGPDGERHQHFDRFWKEWAGHHRAHRDLRKRHRVKSVVRGRVSPRRGRAPMKVKGEMAKYASAPTYPRER